jgi:uncharacterized protein YceK
MKKIALIIACIAMSGCASIISGTDQTISVNTVPPGASCKLLREGTVIGEVSNTPGGVVVEKTKHDITVECAKEGYLPATATLDSGIEGSTFGNIVLGGVIGWGIDSASGADNEYPEHVDVTLVPDVMPAAGQVDQ